MPAGRPKKIIDVEQVKKLAERGWSGRQIAAHFEVDEALISMEGVSSMHRDYQRKEVGVPLSNVKSLVWDKEECKSNGSK